MQSGDSQRKSLFFRQNKQLGGILFLLLCLTLANSLAASSPTVDGRFSNDKSNYTLLSKAAGDRGAIYYHRNGNTLYILVIVSASKVNDNVFGDNTLDAVYMAAAGWNNHNFKHLVNSDHIELVLSSGGSSYTWSQDFVYDADGDKDPTEGDWLSGPGGPDGGGSPPPGLVSRSSLQWSLNNTTWDVTLGGTRTKDTEYKSPDPKNGYPGFDSGTRWEWSVVYEMSMDVSAFGDDPIQIQVVTAHNSPSKDGDPDVVIPPNPITGSIGDYVWHDANGDGVQDAGEAGLPGITVNLKQAGSVFSTQITTAGGGYDFTGLSAGDYVVDVDETTVPAGYVLTTGNEPLSVTFSSGEDYNEADFGYRPPPVDLASIGDWVWNDADMDGVQDAGESGLSGVEVRLYTAGDVLTGTTTTGADGSYGFIDLPPGDYYVKFQIPTNHMVCPCDQGGDDAKDSDANPATGVTITTTLSAGENDPTWDAGLVAENPSIHLEKLTNGEDADTPTGPYINAGTGVVWNYVVTNTGNVPISTLVVTDNIAGVTPVYQSGDANSNSLLDLDETWTYQATGTAVEGQYENTGTVTGKGPEDQDVSDSDDSHYYGAVQVGSIGDFVWEDTDGDGNQDGGENGLPNIRLQLTQNGSTIAYRTTNSSGWYLFTGLSAGTYVVDVDEGTLPQGYALTTHNEPMTVSLSAGQDFDEADFGYRRQFIPNPETGSIGDFIWEDLDWDGRQDGNESGLSDIQVVIYDTDGNLIAEDETNANGYYLFDDLDAGVYVVDVNVFDADMPDQYVCTTNNDPLTVHLGEGEDYLDADFGFMASRPLLGVIGDYTWHDEDWDAYQDRAEEEIPFVYVFLYRDGVLVDSMKTDFFGIYHFVNLEAGRYFVKVNRYGPETNGGGNQPNGLTKGFRPDGLFAAAGDAAWTITTIDSFFVDLDEGEVFLDADFGFANQYDGWGKGRPWILARYQPWFANTESDSALRYWTESFFGGHADTSLFDTYDSFDPDLLEYHILLAWGCGIDGFAVDWYGHPCYENNGIKCLLEKADQLYEKYSDTGYNFEIAASYNEHAKALIDTNMHYVADSLMTHPAYWGKRRGVRRPLFIYNVEEDSIITADEYRCCADTILPPDAFLLWNGTEQEVFDPMDVCHGWVQPLEEWLPDGQDWGGTYLDTTYYRVNYVADPGDLLFALGTVWPGHDDRKWCACEDKFMDRQDTLTYHNTWQMVHDYAYPLSMPWVYIETWNGFNQATEIEPSTDWDYIFNVMTRDHARIFKGSIPPDSVGVDNPGLLVPQHVLQARRVAVLRPQDAATIQSQIDDALIKFFEKEHYQALYISDRAAGIAPKPLRVDAVGDSSITLSWDSAEHANAYNVYYATDASCYEPCAYLKPEKIPVGNVNTYTIEGLKSGFDYYLAVTAADTNIGRYANESWFENGFTGASVVKVNAFAPSATKQEPGQIPQKFELAQNYPNPFNPTTTIAFALPEQQRVRMSLFDIHGREVSVLLNDIRDAGYYRMQLNGESLSSGVYLVQLVTEKYNAKRKIILLK